MPEPILKNIRILDFSWVLAGPYATRLLADFGAEVIKVQPFLPEVEDKYSRGYAATWNRNKLGITLNMGKPAGIEIAQKLVRISDIVAENFSPRVMSNWGLDYPELQKIKADIIYLSLSVMGHSGPLKDYTGFGPTVQSLAGLTGLTAYPGGPPQGPGYSYADHVAGLYASLAVLGALEYRRKTGAGQYIDLSQTETMASLLSETFLDHSLRGKDIKPTGNESNEAAPQGVYPCSGRERWVAISVSTEDEWRGFKRALGNPEWIKYAEFSTLTDRLANRQTMDNFIQDWTIERTAEEAAAILQKEGVPASVVKDAADLARDPQLRERGFFVELDHPELGRITGDASPIRLSESPAEYRRAAPTQGQDNNYVYHDLLGLSDEETAVLKAEGVI